MSDEGFTVMGHEYDGGLCWCGPKCEPVKWIPVTPDSPISSTGAADE